MEGGKQPLGHRCKAEGGAGRGGAASKHARARLYVRPGAHRACTAAAHPPARALARGRAPRRRRAGERGRPAAHERPPGRAAARPLTGGCRGARARALARGGRTPAKCRTIWGLVIAVRGVLTWGRFWTMWLLCRAGFVGQLLEWPP